jgi:hypothetical protein
MKQVTWQGCMLWVTTWMDTRAVNMLSTYLPRIDTCSRNARGPPGTPYVVVNIDRPSAVTHYNAGMGGTDGDDQLLELYRIWIKSKKWTHRIIFHFLGAMVINAWILFKLCYPQARGDKNHMKRDFMVSLFEEIKQTYAARPVAATAEEVAADIHHKSHSSTWSHDLSRLQGTHNPIARMTQGKVRDARPSTIGRPYCRVVGCTRRPVTYCEKCRVHLCIVTKEGTTCWAKFHA